jgi:chromosome segregation protein
MKLARVDITGFKSFGERVELTFHEGVTAIVGPNGCGKSNISDSIGWVLGEQSAKSLRGQKMEDLIFNGSQSRSALSLAEVNLRVTNVNIPVPSMKGEHRAEKGEVLVTRRLDRDGHSEYLLDGVPSRLRDVQDLFMGTGVGAKAYAIIEQGKIGLILSSKPTDRRALIEEAAGVTKYKSRRRSAELKLTAAQQNLLRVNDIVYEITRQMNSLKRQAGKARRYRRLRDAMSKLEKIVAVKRAGHLDAKLQATRSRLAALTDEELRRSTSLATAENYLERARLRQAEQEVALTDAREAQHRLELTIERLEGSIARDKRRVVELDERRQQLEQEAIELEARRGPVIEQLSAREREEAELTNELSGREEQAEEQQGRLKQASLSLAELESSIEERRGEIVHRISKIAALHNFLQGVLANADKVSAELLKLEEELRETGTEEERLESSLQDARGELEEQQRRARTMRTEREALDHEVQLAREKLSTLEFRTSSVREELSQSSARLESLEELVAARAHFASGARFLLTAGEAQGVALKGSMADAIEVDERLERAAEAFFDTALQRILVESERDAGTARELLEGTDEAGRSELLVESLPSPEREDLGEALSRLRELGLPGLVGLLSAGVRVRVPTLARFVPDAIVVETLEQALTCYRHETVAYVSLTGEVLVPPGVVTIGRGGASEGLLSTRREIRELEESVSTLKGRLERARAERDQLAGALAERVAQLETMREEEHRLDKTLVGLEHRKQQLEEEKNRLGRKAEVLLSERSRAESEKKTLLGKRAEMESALEHEEGQKSQAQRALDELRGQLSDHRLSVEELQARAAEERSRLAALRERRDALRFDVERLKEGVTELTARVEAHRAEASSLSSRKSTLEREIVRMESELSDAVIARQEKEDLGRGLEQSVSTLRQRVETTESALKLRRRELSDVRERRSSEEVIVAREDSELDHLRQSFMEAHGVHLSEAAALLAPIELLRGDEETQAELEGLRVKLDAIGPVNPMADEEFRELETRHEFVTRQRQDLLDSIESTETAISRIDRTSRQRFKEAFEAINQEFAVTFRTLFGGGGAGLRLVDEDDLLESGIDIVAQPPGKRLQNVLLLSGGEKAMTAIALLFAIFRYRPSPFCLLDEVDAPLDDANVGRFLAMLRELRDTTQFIIITHNRKTMEMADQLYGVTMEEPGVSKLVSVSLIEQETHPAEAVAT